MDIFILDSYVVILFSEKWTAWGNTWDTNYTPGVDFLDHDFLNLKDSSQDLSNEGCSNITIFWQITKNYKFWPLTTISE